MTTFFFIENKNKHNLIKVYKIETFSSRIISAYVIQEFYPIRS